MRRFGRILLNVATVLSLLFCLAAVALWGRSYWVTDEWLNHSLLPRVAMVLSDRGRFFVVGYHSGAYRNGLSAWAREDGGWSYDARRSETPDAGPPLPWGDGWRFVGFSFKRDSDIYEAVVPLWAVTLATAAPPLLFAYRRLGRRCPGLCPACGYDLRATPDRCPECGAVAEGVSQ